MINDKKEHQRTIRDWLSSVSSNATGSVLGGIVMIFITAFLIANKTDVSPDNGRSSSSVIYPVNRIKIFISGTSLEDLTQKIKSESEKKMKNRNYVASKASIDLTNWTFSCELVEQKSDLIKIVLVYSLPKRDCESCRNVLDKNPGSLMLINTSQSGRIYNVIAVCDSNSSK